MSELETKSTPNFKTAKHTAIISDLHLCEAEPVNERFPLWKKFKTKEFFYDDVFADFLKAIEKKTNGEVIELVLNGDIFDFDSVTKQPEYPLFSQTWIEKRRGLFPRAEKSAFKIRVILDDHAEFIAALRRFVLRGHKVIFITGNHDLELHFPEVQKEIRERLNLTLEQQEQVRFVEWFYISNGDTLIEHGNQYDPYCVCEDPLTPFIRGYNFTSMKLPFGNQACRYITNAMGFFNPHVDTNYIMTLNQYVMVFLRYMIWAQPLIVFTWFFGALNTLWYTFKDRFAVPIKNPYKIEDKTEEVAKKSNATPRMVRELKELFAEPASSRPFLILQELWLDRAFLILIAFFVAYQMMGIIRSIYSVSFFWMLIPMFLFFPFFLFYSKSVSSLVSGYKEPDDRILATASSITHVQRIIFGHTHIVRHEMIGFVEHLNSGCWSPAFLDIECTKPIDQKTFVWISIENEQMNDKEASGSALRRAEVFRFENRQIKPVFITNTRQRQKI